MQYMCITSINMLKYANHKFAPMWKKQYSTAEVIWEQKRRSNEQQWTPVGNLGIMFCCHICCFLNMHASILKWSEAIFWHLSLLEVFVVSICHHFWPFGNTEGARFKRQQASRCCGSCPRTCQFKNWWENICTLWCSRSSYMQKKLIKTSTWYVKFRLPVHNAPDFHIAQCIKQVLNSSDHKRHIGTLSNVSFSYSAQHRWYRNIINMWTNLEMYCRVQ